MTLELRAVVTFADWAAMHELRRRVLFAPGRHAVEIIYDENHPDDRAENQVPLVLTLDEQVIGTARLDLRLDASIVRLVVITPELQRQGHGRLLDAMLTEKARELGSKALWVNAAHDAVGFYEKCGWRRQAWDPDELVGIARSAVQMVKPLD